MNTKTKTQDIEQAIKEIREIIHEYIQEFPNEAANYSTSELIELALNDYKNFYMPNKEG